MKKSWVWVAVLLFVAVVLICPDSALAAPGGKIVSGLFKTTWGKVLLAVLCVVLSPVIAYVMIKEKMAEKRTLKQLREIAKIDPQFDWLAIRDRVVDCFHRVHAAWRAEDMSEASDWMTSWYWQNQQLASLNQWERDGLINHCRVKGITNIRPLFLQYKKNPDGTTDGSRVVISITANMEDYLAERTTGKVVEGKPGYESTEHVWTFLLQNGKWVVGNIEEGTMSLTYAGMKLEADEAAAIEGLRTT